jgi:hypothetical protein
MADVRQGVSGFRRDSEKIRRAEREEERGALHPVRASDENIKIREDLVDIKSQ